MSKDIHYDYSEDFSPEELHDEEDKVKYETLEDKLKEIGMSISDFI